MATKALNRVVGLLAAAAVARLCSHVTECRNVTGGRVGSPCEVKAIEEYLKLPEDDDSDDGGDRDQDEEGEDEAADDGSWEGGAGSPPRKAGGNER